MNVDLWEDNHVAVCLTHAFDWANNTNSVVKISHREAVETLTATLTITEDMASDSGLLTAARFQWLVGEDGSSRATKKTARAGNTTFG